MKNKILFLILGILFSVTGNSANDNYPEGGRSSAMAGASVALIDFWALQNNQAGLAFLDKFSAGVYFENRFLVKELSLNAASVVLPTRSGVFGLNVSYFGYSKFNDCKVGLAYARSFGDVLAFGLQLDYLRTSIAENYGSKGVVSFELGIMSKITKNLTVGAHVYNPARVKIAEYSDERIPTIIRLGASYKIAGNFILCLEAEKDIDFPAVLKAGFEYKIIEKIFVRCGVASNPSLYSFGFGLNFKKLKIDFSSTIHQVLGYSPQISLIYIF